MDKRNLDGVLFLIAGILLFVAAIINKDFIDIPLGCCFVALGIGKRRKEK